MILRDHLEKLHYFYEVAKAGSFKEASQKIGITQPSLTKSIQILEGSIDKKLFLRKPRGVQLTTEGELLYTYCNQLFSQLSDMELKLQAPNDPMAGSLRVGTYDSIAIYFWPNFLRAFIPKFPKLSIEMTTGRSSEIQKLVENNELDLALIIEPKETQSTKVIPIGSDSFHLFQSKENKPIYSNLNEAPLIFMPDALAGKDNARLLQIHSQLESKSKRMVYKTSSLESAKELLIQGIGLALLPAMVAASSIRQGIIEKVDPEGFPKGGLGPHTLGLIYPRHKEESKTLQTLITEIQTQAKEQSIF